jgi:hypothetical protein
MFARVARGATRGLGVVDVMLALALLALLIYVLRLDWRRHPVPPPPAATSPLTG